MKHYGLWMILCCLLPLLVIFMLPLFGVKGDASVFFFVLMMFVCHWMMMGSSHHKDDNGEGQEDKKEGRHGCH